MGDNELKMKILRRTITTASFLCVCIFMLTVYNELTSLNKSLEDGLEAGLSMDYDEKDPEDDRENHVKHKEKHKRAKRHVNQNNTDANETKKLPSVIIIGAPHCGMDALRLFMEQHSHLAGPTKDVNFFTDFYPKGMDFYKSQMPSSTSKQIIFEGSSKYYIDPNAPKRISKTMPENIKLILIVRDPIQRLMTDYLDRKSKFRNSPEASKSLDLLAITERNGFPDPNYEPVKWSSYDLQLPRWIVLFKKEQLLYLDGELLAARPWKLLQEVETFLGLPNEFKEAMFTKSKNDHFRCMTGMGVVCNKVLFPNKKVNIHLATKKAFEKFFYGDKMKNFLKMTHTTFKWNIPQ